MRVTVFALVGMLFAFYVRAQELPYVWILSTGGTIASQYDEDQGGLVPALMGEDMVKAVPELADHARIRVEQVSNIGSPDMTHG